MKICFLNSYSKIKALSYRAAISAFGFASKIAFLNFMAICDCKARVVAENPDNRLSLDAAQLSLNTQLI